MGAFSRGYGNMPVVEPMTEKQEETIEWIEDVVNVSYEGGNNKYEASKFISRYIGVAKEISTYNRRMLNGYY